MHGPKISIEPRPRNDLERQGYACFKGRDLAISPLLKRELSLLLDSYETFPLDQYCKSANRYRRHSRYVLLPWLNLVEPRPISQYTQDRQLNPTDGGVIRNFERLTKEMEANGFLREMILFDFSNTTFTEDIWSTPVDVGVHMIRVVARSGLPGVSSPNMLHKDGEPFTFIHLMRRHRLVGGASLVADNDMRPLVRITLADCLDTVVVSDNDVFHHVEPVEVAPGEPEGHRDVLLIDFTPMSPMTLRAPGGNRTAQRRVKAAEPAYS